MWPPGPQLERSHNGSYGAFVELKWALKRQQRYMKESAEKDRGEQTDKPRNKKIVSET